MSRVNPRFSEYSLWRNQAGAIRLGFMAAVLVLAVIACFRLVASHASAASPIITSGIHGYCLDDYKNKLTPDNMVTAWQCNGSAAQAWTVTYDTITHNPDACLSVKNNTTAVASTIVAAPCTSSSSQIWLRDKAGYYNPNSGLCLAAPNRAGRGQLVLAVCQNLAQAGETWTPSKQGAGDFCNKMGEGEAVSCYATQEWTRWQSGAPSHSTLLNDYTDGAAYEAWCADFVSYVYKEAGHPLTGAYDGWDENDANNLQNYGFTEHLASSGYLPKPGDIAYFNYNGGHVEIVISGGAKPTFIYGNSATIDPTTGNGQMMANTKINDGNEGQLVYYLSPTRE